jgi:hypothetical protein
MFTNAAAVEPHRGWGGLIAIAIALGCAWLVHLATRRNASPTPPTPGPSRVDTQVKAVSDTDDTSADTDWWGRIEEHGGVRLRRFRAVLATGSSDLPEDDVDHDIDLALADEERAPEKVEDLVDRLDRAGTGYMDIVRRLIADYGISEATAKRRVRDARATRPERSDG